MMSKTDMLTIFCNVYIIRNIVRKYSSINIGRALLINDSLIVVVGGFPSGYIIIAGSFVGLLIKTFVI